MVKDYHADANKMLKFFRKGEFDALDELTKKYVKKQ